jgi:hypothetical protein
MGAARHRGRLTLRRIQLLIIFLALGIGAEAVFLVPTIRRVGGQVRDGRKAHVTQCAREPILRKLVVAGAHYRLLRPEDVQTFKRTAPVCP